MVAEIIMTSPSRGKEKYREGKDICLRCGNWKDLYLFPLLPRVSPRMCKKCIEKWISEEDEGGPLEITLGEMQHYNPDGDHESGWPLWGG